ncbi:MAG TPA: flagellar basal body L-ring protein FlgH [Spirochaetota bacterium]|jgi:flagellar basal body L-ring protein FlgH|nr:MAG: Flagellar L-ring protein [Spirochaetes bacterium ADurb.Bin133]HNZ27491.1 flagellar basal body L-ring protein FlgH [Spirochaetota bacterium]HPY86402.1 flagellar basal body L-ring protein FlgH [Spirochaetota bacterium]HQB61674.1 flagellar basal body L-ring protein FlgH [Spirochaetota bacterium]
MKKKFLVLGFLSFCVFFYPETLWNDNYANIYNSKINYSIGDSVLILVNENSSLVYKSGVKSVKNFSINIKGGEYSALLNFLPTGDTSDNKNSSENDDLKIKTELQGRVVAVNGENLGITAQKQIYLNNKISSIQISGTVNVKDIVNGTVASSNIQNQTLRFSSLLQNDRTILNGDDVITIDTTGDAVNKTVVADEKRKEMILNVINNLINAIF